MLKNRKINEYLKSHPEVLCVDDTAAYFIPEDKIPDISWFRDRRHDFETLARTRKPWYLSRKFLIPVAAVLILAVLLAATPVGNVVADVIYKTVIRTFEGGLTIQHGQSTGNAQVEVYRSTYKSVEEVRAVYSGKIAHSTTGTLEEIKMEKTDFSLIIFSTYSIPDNGTVLLTQTVMDGKTEWAGFMDVNGGQAVKFRLKDGTEINGYVSNNIAYAIAYKDYMFIEFNSEHISYEGFIDFLKGIKID